MSPANTLCTHFLLSRGLATDCMLACNRLHACTTMHLSIKGHGSGGKKVIGEEAAYLYPREMSLMPHLALSLSASLRMLLYIVVTICTCHITPCFTPCLHAAAAIHCGVTDTGVTYTCLTVGDGAGSCQVMQDFEGCTCLCYSHSNFYKLAVLHVACMVPLALRS